MEAEVGVGFLAVGGCRYFVKENGKEMTRTRKTNAKQKMEKRRANEGKEEHR